MKRFGGWMRNVTLLSVGVGLGMALSVEGESPVCQEACIAEYGESWIDEVRDRGWVGADLKLTSDPLALEVSRLVAGGPLAEAGLIEGDEIIALDGIVLAETGKDFRAISAATGELLRELGPGESVEVVYRRQGARLTTTLEPGRYVGNALAQRLGWQVLKLTPGGMRLFAESP